MTIIQEETTGCGLAAVANIVGESYAAVKAKANALGISAQNELLYSDTVQIRNLLNEYGVRTSENEIPFKSWESLPDIALLSIKSHLENAKPFWHWVVFKREFGSSVVLDSAPFLEINERTDFEAMNPKWYIGIE